MKLFIPTEDPAMDSDAPAELPIPYHPDYPCLRHYRQGAGSEYPAATTATECEVGHGWH